MSTQLRWILKLGIAVLFGGCVTKTPIQDVMAPLSVLREIIKSSMPLGVKSESVNGRELTSGFFRTDDFDELAEDERIRAYAVVTILGDRRPYQIDVKVFRQLRERSRGETKFKNLGVDKRLTARLVEKLKEAIANRPVDRNVVDDFKPF